MNYDKNTYNYDILTFFIFLQGNCSILFEFNLKQKQKLCLNHY